MDSRTLRILEYNKVVGMLSDYAKSSLGKQEVLELKPSSDIEVVKKRLNETREAESILLSEGIGFVSEFPDIRKELRRAQIGSILSPAELLNIARVLEVAASCKKAMREYKGKAQLEIIPDLISKLRLHQELLSSINRCIESEEAVADNASSQLADIRRRILKTHDKVRDRLNGIIHSTHYLKMLQEPIVTIRNNRYVVPVKQEYRSTFQGIIHDQSSSGATLFIEPMSVVDANNELRQLSLEEEEEIERILAQLTIMVEAVWDELAENLNLLKRLDFIFAKGAFSIALECIHPKVVDDRRFVLKNARHPFIEKDKVVPINISFGRDYTTVIITGPNTGGKTVTLKTVGLFILMAQSGLHLPADYGTEIGIFNNVYADIGDEQSIEQSLSTFSSHMTNIVKILDDITYEDMVLFDELGAGTDPTEGAALAMSILDYLHSRKIATMATTHYSELKMYGLKKEGIENASVEFDVETLRPTYRIQMGIPGKSNAFEISKRLGLNDELIEGAKKYLTSEAIHFEDIISDIETKRSTAEKELIEANLYLKEIEELRESLIRKDEELNQRKSDIMARAKEEARRIVLDAKAQSETIIKELKQLAAEEEAKRRNRAIEDARMQLKESVEKLEPENPLQAKAKRGKPPKNLKLGETVYIINLDKDGTVINLPDNNGELTVQIGIMKINVNIKDVRRVKDSSSKAPTVRPSKKSLSFRRAVLSELDLRGMNGEDAIIETEKYLDEAFLSGLKEVTIIHGKGTGILRSTVHELLKRNPHVKSYRLGKFGEGESGVTVCTLE